MGKEIKVVVEKDGKVKLEVGGVTGSECLSVTSFLEKEMGKVCDRQRTGDFYKASSLYLKNRTKNRN